MINFSCGEGDYFAEGAEKAVRAAVTVHVRT